MKQLVYNTSILWLCFLLYSTTMLKGNEVGEVVVHFLDFDVGTYEPITVDLIEPRAHCRFSLAEHDTTVQVLQKAMKNLQDGIIARGLVRLKINGVGAQPIFIDQLGGVKLGLNGSHHSLSSRDYWTIRQAMESLADEHGCRKPRFIYPDEIE